MASPASSTGGRRHGGASVRSGAAAGAAALQVAVAQSYGRLPSRANAQAGAVSGRAGAVVVSAVPRVVVLRAGSFSRQVTSVADCPVPGWPGPRR